MRVSLHAIVLFGVFGVLSTFFLAGTVQGLGNMADLMCLPVVQPPCLCGTKMGPKGCMPDPTNKFMCPCFDITNGFKTMGVCIATMKCQGQSADGMMPMLPMIPMIPMSMSMPPMDSGLGYCEPGAASSSARNQNCIPNPYDFGCSSTYFVTQPSSDPCAIYSPEILGSDLSDSLFDALNATTPTENATVKVNSTPKSTPTPTPANTPTTTVQVRPIGPGAASSSQLKPQGFAGDVFELSAGATIVGSFREGLSEVAGFFGAGSSGSSSAAGRLCQSRPWTRGLLTSIIPSAFFDGLCKWSGYQVGSAQPVSGSTYVPPPKKSAETVPAQASYAQTNGEVEIWAEPESVRLGTRTYIFWNSRNVVSCRAEGPSFVQTTLSGGASTVPITGPSTFSIECTTASGATVKDAVTVQIAI